MKYIFLALMLNSVFLHAATGIQQTQEAICSDQNSICLDGTIEFDSLTGKVVYSGNVRNAKRAGEVRAILSGKSILNGDFTFLTRSLRFIVSGIESQKITIELQFKKSIGKTDMIWTLANVLYLDEIIKIPR